MSQIILIKNRLLIRSGHRKVFKIKVKIMKVKFRRKKIFKYLKNKMIKSNKISKQILSRANIILWKFR